MDLTEFLLARIAEDEAVARAVITERDQIPWAPGCEPDTSDTSAYADMDSSVPHVAVGPERVLADCGAKREIVREAQRLSHSDRLRHGDYWRGGADAMHGALLILARPYADHSDYRPAWRP